MARVRQIDPLAFDPPVGVAEWVVPGVRRIVAPNPSAMTFRGTNSYIVGHGSVALIDPGPMNLAHRDALDAALSDETVSHILVTHAHLDHSPLARTLADQFGAPVLAFGDAFAGRSPTMADLAARGFACGGEGVDRDFSPDATLADGDRIEGRGWQLTAWHTLDHMGNHLGFALDDMVFSGDLIMGWSSSLISPPDGDLADFLASCARVSAMNPAMLLPGHGGPVLDPTSQIDALVAHRTARTSQILACLEASGRSLAQITRAVYPDLAPDLLPMAERNVFAHLIALKTADRVETDGDPSPEVLFKRSPTDW